MAAHVGCFFHMYQSVVFVLSYLYPPFPNALSSRSRRTLSTGRVVDSPSRPREWWPPLAGVTSSDSVPW